MCRDVGKCGDAWDAWQNAGNNATTLDIHTTPQLHHLSRGHQKAGRADGGESKGDEILWADTWWSGSI